jgi:hypothetical protein
MWRAARRTAGNARPRAAAQRRATLGLEGEERIMNRLRHPGSLRGLLVMLLVLQLVAIAARSPATLAQGGGIMLTQAGQTITWDAPWSVDPQRSSGSSGIDIVVLHSGTASVAIVTGPITLGDTARGLVLGLLGADTESATVIDQGASDGLSYWLDLVPMPDGATAGVFTTAVAAGAGGILTMVLSPVDTFGDAMTSAQAAIAIDDAPVFEGVDATAMQAALGASTPAAPAAPVTSATSATPNTGFVAAGTWTDPTYGYTVEWADGWTRSENPTGIHLAPADAQVVMVDVWAEPRGPSHDPLAFTQSAREILSAIPQDITIPVHTESHVIVVGINRFTISAMELILPEDGTTAILTMVVAGGGDPATAIPPIQAGVHIDGRPILDGWNPARGTATESTPASAAKAVPAPDGFMPAGSWTHPVYDYTIEWAPGWSIIDQPDEETIVVGRDDGDVFVFIEGVRGTMSADLTATVDMLVDMLPTELDATVVDTYVGANNAIIVARATDVVMVFEIAPRQGGPVCVTLTLGINPTIDVQAAVASYRASVRIDGVAPLDGWEQIQT